MGEIMAHVWTFIVISGLGIIVKILLPMIERLVNAHLDEKQRKKLAEVVEILVKAAEQTLAGEPGKVRLERVVDWLTDRGLPIDYEMIEKTVRELHADGYAIEKPPDGI
ncbi:hypothetical protein FACS18948_6560 [Clostridia bacterium]|nr:hypothetical protein FACS18948_6560 [Clostridia bacterium]